MDPATGLTILGSAVGGAKLVEKLLGPTADYVGTGLKNWAEKRVTNASRIFEKAAEKLGSRIDEPGAVPPRVLKEILDEGLYCDDELTAEYFGGVLASSRSSISRDDRAASYLKLTSSLHLSDKIPLHLVHHMEDNVYWFRTTAYVRRRSTEDVGLSARVIPDCCYGFYRRRTSFRYYYAMYHGSCETRSDR